MSGYATGGWVTTDRIEGLVPVPLCEPVIHAPDAGAYAGLMAALNTYPGGNLMDKETCGMKCPHEIPTSCTEPTGHPGKHRDSGDYYPGKSRDTFVCTWKRTR